MPPEVVEASTPAPAPAPSMADLIGQSVGLESSPPAPVEPQEQAEPQEEPQRARGPDGKFVKREAEPEAKPEPTATDPKAKPEQKPEAKPEAPKPEDDLAMPEGLGAKAQQRFQKLANTVKELTTFKQEAEPMVAAFREFEQVLHDNGVEREQFDRTMSYVGAVNRGDLKSALAILDEEREAIALMAGVELPGVDLLRHYPDLKEAVEDQRITREHAAEVAAARRARFDQQAAHEQQRSTQQQQQDDQRARTEALVAIDKFLVGKQNSDLNFAAKSKALESAILRACKGLPPHVWPTVVTELYEAASQMLPAATSPATDPTPLRPNGNANGARPRPASMAEAIGQTLGIE